MKQAQREIYQVLANEANFNLCSFCKYSVMIGCCCDGGIECHHPLYDQSRFEKQVDNAMELGDCWGFRPEHPLEFCTDIVGIVLSKGWSTATWWQSKTGQWKITGTS